MGQTNYCCDCGIVGSNCNSSGYSFTKGKKIKKQPNLVKGTKNKGKRIAWIRMMSLVRQNLIEEMVLT